MRWSSSAGSASLQRRGPRRTSEAKPPSTLSLCLVPLLVHPSPVAATRSIRPLASERLRWLEKKPPTHPCRRIRAVKAAEADAESKFLQGQGIARQRQAIINGLKDSVVGFSGEVPGISSTQVLEMMMITQVMITHVA